MITITDQQVDEQSGEISVKFRVQPYRDGVFKWSPDHTVKQIMLMGIKVGDLLSGEVVCNKPNFSKQYTYKFAPVAAKIVKKEEKIIDKPKEQVIIKKTRSRKTKSVGG